jgi:hypothetical protein
MFLFTSLNPLLYWEPFASKGLSALHFRDTAEDSEHSENSKQ